MSEDLDDGAAPFAVERITRLVHTFYGRVQDDALLGPVFAKRIEDWGPHLERMVLFWRAVLRAERTFTVSPRGGPPTLHRAIDELSLAHFERWLALFGEVADLVFEEGPAEIVKEAAGRIAFSLSRHLDTDAGPRFEVRHNE